MYNHQPSLIENPVYCNVHYYKFPYPSGCTNNLENAMSEYFIVEKVNLGAKLKPNWHISWAFVSNKEELLFKLVAQLIS